MKGKLPLYFLFVLLLFVVMPRFAVGEIINSGVAFRETGLPSGTSWTVICNGTLYNSNSSDITITLPPGTYSFSVPDIQRYTASPNSGNVTAYLDPIRLTTIAFSPAVPELSIPGISLGLFVVSVFVLFLALVKRQ